MFLITLYSGSRWNLNSSYNIHLNLQNASNSRCSNASTADGAVFFYARLPADTFFSLPVAGETTKYTVTSRQLVTNFLNLIDARWSPVGQNQENLSITCEPAFTTTAAGDEITTENKPIPVTRTDAPDTTTDVITILESNIRLAVRNGGENINSYLQSLISVRCSYSIACCQSLYPSTFTGS